ncbi:efflux RND transporter periplasmic adaptor subunit [Tranquillimonas alkanivorans]|uniref:Membrane fusion protein, multidrug efflux system n=1 Tax=Tranquillimonas alkanivorans TaxID=441119 RepID=A0A1I5PLE2_9RHOB|nr:efflux RND transporter periplasmic adaptor subunit [Tranquillimonas alkanivorans]SFP34717.1 membrane fusion protein, multidrug efflux system [Tranquillimonas alkanivorans]
MPDIPDDRGARQPLTFDSDRGASRSKWIAAALVVALVAWMASGFVLPSEETESATPVSEAPRAVAVAVRESAAEPVTQYFTAEGQALPQRRTVVLAEAAGEVVELAVRKGAMAEDADLIARLDPARQEADLEGAREELRRAERDLQNAETLLDRGTGTVDRVAQARSTVAAVRAQVAAAEDALDATFVRAPFAGRVEALPIEEGEFVTAGATVAEVVDAVPLTVAIQVPQQSLAALEVGQPAQVSFITGQQATGEVVFVGASAAAETRTFLAEIEVPNEDSDIPAGVSAEVRIPTGEAVAHFLSPAILSLGPDGELGVKTVGEDDRVVFHEVEIVRAQTDGVWVAGLPQEAEIITVGQGFVSAGELVAPQPEVDITQAGAVEAETAEALE